jgi:flagellar protein FliS
MNAHASYQESNVLTASPEQLVVLLYDGAVRFLRQSEAALREHAWSQGFERLQRAEAIVDELLSTLNMDAGELSERLQAIYVFCKSQLMEARLQRDPAKVAQVAALLAELRESWAKLAAGAAATA